MANCIGDFVASLSEKERDDIMNQYNGLIEKGMSDRGATAQIAMQETKKLVDDLNSLKKSIGAPTVAFAIPENINKILAIENEPIAKPIIAETSKEEHIISPTDTEGRRKITFDNFKLEKEGNQFYEYYINPEGKTEEIYGKNEQEVKDKIGRGSPDNQCTCKGCKYTYRD